ncbi:aminotransferase class V-fold PLP-dependent enzyme [Micromonospora sp. NPDC049679]|uniref:aminotransferase class V-fold PLP-dependent enzyme n=1 Tax=Micromonospora sp. NPDC049679 TaxID=3155920 RepID=UPI0033FBEB6B
MTTDRCLDAPAFRALFPALESYAWLDTPGSPPLARPVGDVLSATLDAWLAGDFDWLAWDHTPQDVRTLFARYVGVDPDAVALMGSVAEGATTVARSLPPGRIVVSDEEFRSNLFPWLQLDPATHDVVRVTARDGAVRTEDLVAACGEGTVLLAVSEVLSRDGVRADLAALRAATDQVGARLFIDASQSLGVLHLDFAALRPDYVAVHGYKWMFCPRGAAWLVVREDRQRELRPLLPSWKSTPLPHGYFGGGFEPGPGMARCDTSPAWLSWIGAEAALGIHLRLDPVETERHSIALAQAFLEGAEKRGATPVASGLPSQIAAVHVRDPGLVRERLRERRVKATMTENRLRVGFHYFNHERDLEAVLSALG